MQVPEKGRGKHEPSVLDIMLALTNIEDVQHTRRSFFFRPVRKEKHHVQYVIWARTMPLPGPSLFLGKSPIQVLGLGTELWRPAVGGHQCQISWASLGARSSHIGLSSVLGAPSHIFYYYMYIITLTPSSSPNYRHLSLIVVIIKVIIIKNSASLVHQISPSSHSAFPVYIYIYMSSMCRLFIWWHPFPATARHPRTDPPSHHHQWINGWS